MEHPEDVLSCRVKYRKNDVYLVITAVLGGFFLR